METDREVADLAHNPALNSSSSIKCPTTPTNDIRDVWETKAAAVLQLLNEDIKAADLKWSLFIAASDSFRHESCLKPFPPKYTSDGTKDFDSLMNVIAKTESLGLLLEYLRDPSYIASHKEVVDLLHYILVNLREPYLKSVRPEEFDTVLKKVPSETEACRPQYIFEVVSTPTSQSENRWKSLSKNKNTLYAYHGSKLENFHSIIHHGLQQHLNKVSAFGTGIYLSSELSVSLPYSPVGLAWGSSSFGPELSCLAMCQLIQTEGIYCQKTGDSKAEQIQCRVRDSKAGEVPLKYFVVANNELVKLRYLLLYCKEPPSLASLLRRPRDSPVRRWFSQHKLLTMLFGYSFMLATIGLANNNQMQYYYRVLVKKLETAIKGLKF